MSSSSPFRSKADSLPGNRFINYINHAPHAFTLADNKVLLDTGSTLKMSFIVLQCFESTQSFGFHAVLALRTEYNTYARLLFYTVLIPGGKHQYRNEY